MKPLGVRGTAAAGARRNDEQGPEAWGRTEETKQSHAHEAEKGMDDGEGGKNTMEILVFILFTMSASDASNPPNAGADGDGLKLAKPVRVVLWAKRGNVPCFSRPSTPRRGGAAYVSICGPV